MDDKHYKIYLMYYTAVHGRFYTREQRLKLFGLFLNCGDICRGTEEYSLMFDALSALEEENLSDYSETMNYKMLCSMNEIPGERYIAASALAEACENNMSSKNIRRFKSFLDWIITLRTTFPKTEEIKFELAYYNYAVCNLNDAISELEDLVNGGNAHAIELLAVIHKENGNFEKAYYYFALLESVYRRELKTTAPEGVLMNKYSLGACIPIDLQSSIDKEIEELSWVIIKEKRPVVGFTIN